jgi:hypothetical protein
MSFFALEIADKHSNVWSADNCSIPSIYVVLAFIKQAVETQQVKHYEVVVSELTRLYDANGNVIPFRVYMRLLIALKVMVNFHCFVCSADSIHI